MRTRSAKKGPTKKGSVKTPGKSPDVVKSETLVEIPDDDLQTAPEQKPVGDEFPGSPASPTREVLSETKPESAQEEASFQSCGDAMEGLLETKANLDTDNQEKMEEEEEQSRVEIPEEVQKQTFAVEAGYAPEKKIDENSPEIVMAVEEEPHVKEEDQLGESQGVQGLQSATGDGDREDKTREISSEKREGGEEEQHKQVTRKDGEGEGGVAVMAVEDEPHVKEEDQLGGIAVMAVEDEPHVKEEDQLGGIAVMAVEDEPHVKEEDPLGESQGVQGWQSATGDGDMEDKTREISSEKREGGEEEQHEHVTRKDGEGGGIADEYPDVEHTMPLSERQKRKKLEVFVGGIEKDATEEDLKEVFKQVGEVTEVRLMKNTETGKNKGYGFVRYATIEQAKRAAAELNHVQVRGKSCGVLPSEENDTLFIGNINKTWKKEAVMEKLVGFGIENVEELTLMVDPQNEGSNRGFAFMEFTTHKDALKAFKRLQQPDAIFGADRSAKVAWAQPLNEPDEVVMAQVKSVFVDGMPPTWDETQVTEHFGKYGEIERVVLARNMSSAKRKDFGFVNYATREAAVACIEAVNNTEVMDGDKKMKVKVSLAKPQTKSRPVKGGVRGGYPVQRGGSLAMSRGDGVQGSGRIASRGGRGLYRGGLQPIMGRSSGLKGSLGDGSSQQQLLQVLRGQPFTEERPQGRGLSGSRGGIARGTGFSGRSGYFGSSQVGRGRQAVPGPSSLASQGRQFGQVPDRGFVTGYNHGVTAGVGYNAAIREYGGAVPGVKRAYGAMEEDPRFADAALRHSRARLDLTLGSVGSQIPGKPVYGSVVRGQGRTAPYGGRGGHYPSGGPGHTAAYPREQHTTGAERIGDSLHPSSVYGAAAGSGGFPVPGAGGRLFY